MPTPLIQGVFVVDKPPKVSSAWVVRRVKRLMPRGVKVGHAGTLDPFATGVLLILVGSATRASERLMGLQKRYTATVKLGAATATLDPTWPELTDGPLDPTPVDEAALRAAVEGLVGEMLQAPPAFSALKVAGRPAYELAKRGRAVTLEPRVVRVYEMRVTRYEWPAVELAMEVGRGFYVRSLARDLAAAVGTRGYLTALRRTAVGPFEAGEGVSPIDLTAATVLGRLRAVP